MNGTNMFVEKKSAIFHGTPDIYKTLSSQMSDSELVRLPYFSQLQMMDIFICILL